MMGGNHKVLRTAGSNLRYSMYEFIEAVRKRSIIWERRHPNFHNRELRDLAWQQIGQELCNNFGTASEQERQEIVKTLLKRWKNTRDSYLRVNRLRQSGEEVSRASYIYETELSFLLDVKAETDEDDEEPAKFEQNDKPKVPVKRRRPAAALRTPKLRRNSLDRGHKMESDLEHTPTLARENVQSTALVGVSQITSEMTTSLGDLNAYTYAPAPTSADPDQAFFDSIKPHMQQMGADRKLDFQIEVLKILRNFKPN